MFLSCWASLVSLSHRMWAGFKQTKWNLFIQIKYKHVTFFISQVWIRKTRHRPLDWHCYYLIYTFCDLKLWSYLEKVNCSTQIHSTCSPHPSVYFILPLNDGHKFIESKCNRHEELGRNLVLAYFFYTFFTEKECYVNSRWLNGRNCLEEDKTAPLNKSLFIKVD